MRARAHRDLKEGREEEVIEMMSLASTVTVAATMQEIANMTKTSIGSVKRAIKSLMKKGDVMRAPFQSGYILTKNNK